MFDTAENTAADEFLVVRNHEEQYSVWFADQPIPAGWEADGVRGTRQQCLDHVEAVWTDMRPASLRRHLDG